MSRPGPALHLLADEPTDSLPPVSCGDCTGLCCRLTVVLGPGDERVPESRVFLQPDGLRVMARDERGVCASLGADRQRCTIYADRPQACRRFTMGGPYCRAIREDAERAAAPGR